MRSYIHLQYSDNQVGGVRVITSLPVSDDCPSICLSSEDKRDVRMRSQGTVKCMGAWVCL